MKFDKVVYTSLPFTVAGFGLSYILDQDYLRAAVAAVLTVFIFLQMRSIKRGEKKVNLSKNYWMRGFHLIFTGSLLFMMLDLFSFFPKDNIPMIISNLTLIITVAYVAGSFVVDSVKKVA
jgi:hypothetical protein